MFSKGCSVDSPESGRPLLGPLHFLVREEGPADSTDSCKQVNLDVGCDGQQMAAGFLTGKWPCHSLSWGL